MSDGRTRHSSGGEWEASYGYCRALRVGDRILVSGCTSTVDGVVLHRYDAAAQLRMALRTALTAVTELGGCAGDVVLTRMYVTHRRDCDAVGRAHGELLGEVRPVATMVVVAGLLHPDMRVEVEVEAVVGGVASDAPS